MYLGLDIGTTNVKALVVKKNGRIVSRSSATVRIYHVSDGGIEQDIDEIFKSVIKAIKTAVSQVDASNIEAIGISSQGGALQILDGKGSPIGRVISWMDQRGRKYDDEIGEVFGTDYLIKHTGHARSKMALGYLLRCKHKKPSLIKKPNLISFVGDIIVSRLCGRRAHDGTSLSCSVLYDLITGKSETKILSFLGVNESQLPDLLPACEIADKLIPEVAKKTSLPSGIPVSCAVHDQYAAALGAGATESGDIMFGSGTAWVLLAVSKKFPKPVVEDAFSCNHIVKPLYGQILSISDGGSSITWALNALGFGEVDNKEIDGILEKAPAGSDGARFIPFLSMSGRTGIPQNMRGRLTGLRLLHTREHILRAVVEGLAFELNRHIGFLSDAGVPVKRLIMCGGASASKVTPQIIADITNLPVDCVTESATSALGAAMLARSIVEPENSLVKITGEMRQKYRRFKPGDDVRIYRKAFCEYLQFLEEGKRC
jgi:xylulokinase